MVWLSHDSWYRGKRHAIDPVPALEESCPDSIMWGQYRDDPISTIHPFYCMQWYLTVDEPLQVSIFVTSLWGGG